MKILVSCEMSGLVRQAFRNKGHDAYSCDLLPAMDRSPYHYAGDVRPYLNLDLWDMLIAFPPCDKLSVSGQHWKGRHPEWTEDNWQAGIDFFMLHALSRIPKIAIENPVGIMSTTWRKPDQIIQPFDFGEDASKKTCLWLKGLQPLKPTKHISGRLVEWPVDSGKMVERWSNQTDSGQNKLGPSDNRKMIRSLTYQGIADAMAEQWG